MWLSIRSLWGGQVMLGLSLTFPFGGISYRCNMRPMPASPADWSVSTWPLSAPALLLVAVGGGLGAVLRHGAVLALAPLATRAGWPVGVLLVNVLGSLLLGLLLALVGRGIWPDWVRLALGTGVLGGFTTFSTLSTDLDGLMQRGAYGEAALYLSLSIGGGVLGAIVGRWLGNALVGAS